MLAIRRSYETERTLVPSLAGSSDDLEVLTREFDIEKILSTFNLDWRLWDEAPRNSSSIHRDFNFGSKYCNDESRINKRTPPIQIKAIDDDLNLIVWNGPDDPECPVNWPKSRKWLYITILCSMVFCESFASSIFSVTATVTSQLFNTSLEVMTLGTSLFVLGLAFGPLVWGPMSELFGRKRPLFVGFFTSIVLQVATAATQSLYIIMVTRFLGGLFGSAPSAIGGGVLVDFFGPVDRGIAACLFAVGMFVGPTAGPIAGELITRSYLGWRWTAYIAAITAFILGVIGVLIVPESHAATILQARAKKIRFETKNWAIHSKADESKVDLHNIFHIYLFRPLEMLAGEPILLLLSLYISLVYGILYLFLEAYPISFQQKRGWNNRGCALPFACILIGMILGSIIVAIYTRTRFARKFKKNGHVVPEEHLLPMIFGSLMLPLGLFWFALASLPEISWVYQVIAGIPIGCGILLIFLQGFNYIIDVYTVNINSAFAANTLLRCLTGTGFSLFAIAMFKNLDVAWATSFLGFICLALIPVPICFFRWGKKLRSFSKFILDNEQ